MPKKLALNIDPDLYQKLEQLFKDNEQGLNQFIIDAIKNQLKASAPLLGQGDDLKNYLKQGPSGSRTYGIKGQGW
jgi:hypothetical protein